MGTAIASGPTHNYYNAPTATGAMPTDEPTGDGRDHWQGRLPFILAAMGSAIGLGNVWRFPYIAYQYGGGAFLIPYLIALITTGIPMMALEFGLGYRFLSGAPKAFGSIDRRLAWIGWFAIFLGFIIVSYYTVIMAWCLLYMLFSFDVSWGRSSGEVENFFFHDFLNVSSGPTAIGGFQISILLALIVMWALIYIILAKGVQRVGKVVLITVPLPVILLVILFLRGITLDGAMTGVDYYLTPDTSRLSDGSVWLAAYGQVFFTLSLAQGVMIAYASYLPKRSELMNNAVIISLANCGTSFFAGFAVFSILGFVAAEQGTGIGDAAAAGPHLAFVTYPLAIAKLPFGAAVFGIIFFLMLLTLGIDSAFSMIEALSAGLEDMGFEHRRAVQVLCLAGFSVGLIYVTGAGYWLLELVDHYAAGFGLVLVGLLEVLVVGYVMRTEEFRRFINEHSEVKLGRWWDISIRYVTPLVLVVILAVTFADGLTFTAESVTGHEVTYPLWLVIAGGWGLIALLLAAAYYLGGRSRWD